MEEKIKVAVDSCVVLTLAKIFGATLSDEDKAVVNCLKAKALNPDLFKNVPYKYLPSLLKDKFLGEIVVGTDGNSYYTNLNNLWRLWEMVEEGKCELYITPTVFGELDFEWDEACNEFINNHVSVVRIEDADAEKFYTQRDDLAKAYVKQGAMKESFNAAMRKKLPQNDAYIMAEASLCGFMLITINEKDFVNIDNREEDFARSDIISNVNRDFGLVFDSNIHNCKTNPKPLTLESFIMRARYRRDGYKKPYYIVNPNVVNDTFIFGR